MITVNFVQNGKRFIFNALLVFILLLTLNTSCSSPSQYAGQSKIFDLKYGSHCEGVKDNTTIISDSFDYGGVEIKYRCLSSFRDNDYGLIKVENKSDTHIKLSFNDVTGENTFILSNESNWFNTNPRTTLYDPKGKGVTGIITFLPNTSDDYEENIEIDLSKFSCGSDPRDLDVQSKTGLYKLNLFIRAECNYNKNPPRVGTRFSSNGNTIKLTSLKNNKSMVIGSSYEYNDDIEPDIEGIYKLRITVPRKIYFEGMK